MSRLGVFKEKVKADVAKNRERIEELGPGIITGGAGDDPAGIVTYTMVGATTGFSQLWLLLLSTPMMIAVQNTITRIAIVTGKSLPELTTAYYGKKVTIFMILVLALANILTIGADLQAIAAIFGIIFGKDAVYFLIPITALIAYLVMYHSYRTIKKVLIGFTAVLVVYIMSAIMAKPDVEEVLINTFVPHIEMNSAWIIAALGLLGTTISPYLMFWQASEEKEEQKTVVQAESVTTDTVLGMTYSNILAYAMIISGAVMFYGHVGSSMDTVEGIAQALRPVGGEYAFALFSLGVIVAGLLAIPVLAGSTAYAVADAFRWRAGMDNKISDAKGFYFVFLGAMIVGDLIDLSSLSVVDALYYSQVLDGVLLPFLLVIILMLSNNTKIMGQYTNGRFNNGFSLFTLVVTVGLTAVMFWNLIS
jgi:NRAMP (natural resistance-associated macrophage protein)-like metal ion transporter